jgi:hypothetical protein
MTQHADALAWAKAQVGKHEQPSGSNTGTFVLFCQRATWLAGTRWPWCVAFFQRAWAEAGKPLPYRGAGAWAFYDWAKQHGWAISVSQAEPGDACIWNLGSGHCSMFERLQNGRVHSIDGNVSDKVSECERSASELRGCIHIPEPAHTHHAPPAAQPTQAAKPPLYEVVGSVSGHSKVVFVGKQKTISRKLGRFLNARGGVTIRRHKRR